MKNGRDSSLREVCVPFKEQKQGQTLDFCLRKLSVFERCSLRERLLSYGIFLHPLLHYSIPNCIILAILQIWSSIWCFSYLAIWCPFHCMKSTMSKQRISNILQGKPKKEHCQVNITKVNVKGYISVSQCCSIPHHILLEPLTVVHTSEH